MTEVAGGVVLFNSVPQGSICSFIVDDDNSTVVSSYCNSDFGKLIVLSLDHMWALQMWKMKY